MIYNLDPMYDDNLRRTEPHWRIYHPRGKLPTVVQVQDADYRDYEYSRFVTYEVFASEDSALAGLDTLQDHARRLLA